MVPNGGDLAWERTAVVPVVAGVAPRKLAKVPFVELADGRLQGVVSSGSDIARVYVSSVAARTHRLSCSTNNNRPCGGLSAHDYGGHITPCKHIIALMAEAMLQYGQARVVRYLEAEVAEDNSMRLSPQSTLEPTPAAVVFSRFLRHLAYLELPDSAFAIPELQWFPATGGR
ncbi:hypothetical protein AB0B25_23855 [Nocardia sp. NPDC049190]|uniref:hypothetical protein n=1 Tax=Nocardia sp. NPDC049190 TaxID=3155650 RepID=UPI003400BE7C